MSRIKSIWKYRFDSMNVTATCLKLHKMLSWVLICLCVCVCVSDESVSVQWYHLGAYAEWPQLHLAKYSYIYFIQMDRTIMQIKCFSKAPWRWFRSQCIARVWWLQDILAHVKHSIISVNTTAAMYTLGLVYLHTEIMPFIRGISQQTFFTQFSHFQYAYDE